MYQLNPASIESTKETVVPKKNTKEFLNSNNKTYKNRKTVNFSQDENHENKTKLTNINNLLSKLHDNEDEEDEENNFNVNEKMTNVTNEHTNKDLINTVSKCLGIKVIWKKDKKGLEFAISNINKEHIKKNQMIIKQDPIYFRPNEVHNLIGNYNKAQKLLNWQPKINFNELISEMVRSDLAKFS